MTTYPLVLADSATMLRRNLRRMRRYPSLTFFIAGIPVVLLLLFVYVFGGTLGAGLGEVAGGRAEYIAYVVPGILLITVAGAAQGTAISVAMDMTEGIIARFRTMDIARVSVLTGHVIGSVIQTMLAIAIVMVVAVLIGFRSTTGPIEWLAATGLLVLAALAISWLSVALGMAAKSVETASNLPMFLILLPFLSSGFVPTESMPDGLSWFAEHQPFTPLIETVRGLLARHADRQQRRGRRRLVRRDLGRRLSLGATAVRPRSSVLGPDSTPVDVHDLDRFGEALERGAPQAGRPVRLPDRRDARDDLAGAAECRDPGRLVDALAVEVAADLRGIGGMEADPDLGREALCRAVLRESPLDRDRRLHRKVRRVEADEEPVAGRGDLLAAVGREHLPEGRVVPAEDRLPGLVAKGLDEVRRADDVGEHEGLQDAAGRTGLAAQLPGQQL